MSNPTQILTCIKAVELCVLGLSPGISLFSLQSTQKQLNSRTEQYLFGSIH